MFWWTWGDSKSRPFPCHGSALPTAPQAHGEADLYYITARAFQIELAPATPPPHRRSARPPRAPPLRAVIAAHARLLHLHRRDRRKVLIDRANLPLTHVGITRPRHHLEQRTELRMRLVEIGPLGQSFLKLLERQARRQAVGLGCEIARDKRSESHTAPEVRARIHFGGLTHKGVSTVDIRRIGVAVDTSRDRVYQIASPADQERIFATEAEQNGGDLVPFGDVVKRQRVESVLLALRRAACPQ